MNYRHRLIETSLFALVCLVFVTSTYHFLSDRSEDESAQTLKLDEKREVNTTSYKNSSYFIQCEELTQSHETTSARVRITGPLCGVKGRKISAIGTNLTINFQPTIENTTSNYHATVFQSFQDKKFTTDYIPLEPGLNRIEVAFPKEDGNLVSYSLSVVRKVQFTK